MPRRTLSDTRFDRIAPAARQQLSGNVGDRGGTARRHPLCPEAVLVVARNGGRWRSLPERFGTWSSIAVRLDRQSRAGVWCDSSAPARLPTSGGSWSTRRRPRCTGQTGAVVAPRRSRASEPVCEREVNRDQIGRAELYRRVGTCCLQAAHDDLGVVHADSALIRLT